MESTISPKNRCKSSLTLDWSHRRAATPGASSQNLLPAGINRSVLGQEVPYSPTSSGPNDTMRAIESPQDSSQPSTAAAVPSKMKHAAECSGVVSESDPASRGLTGSGYVQSLQDPDPHLTELQHQNLNERTPGNPSFYHVNPGCSRSSFTLRCWPRQSRERYSERTPARTGIFPSLLSSPIASLPGLT